MLQPRRSAPFFPSGAFLLELAAAAGKLTAGVDEEDSTVDVVVAFATDAGEDPAVSRDPTGDVDFVTAEDTSSSEVDPPTVGFSGTDVGLLVVVLVVVAAAIVDGEEEDDDDNDDSPSDVDVRGGEEPCLATASRTRRLDCWNS